MIEDRLQSQQKQATIRNFFRVGGAVAFGLGLILTVIGFISFFSAFASIAAGPSGGGPSFPKYFWCAFLGLPLMGLGGWMSMFGFMGAVQRYLAGESAPVAKDVVNYMGENIQPGIKAVAKAVTEGIIEAQHDHKQPHDGTA